jgi:hypothetical protein
MKGFVITLDAMVGLMLFMLLMIVLAGQSYHPRSPGNIYLKQLTLDTMSVLEKTGGAEAALLGNSSRMQELLEATPELSCIRLSIIDGSGSIVTSAARADCGDSTGLDMQTASRPLIFRGDGYILRAESWFRKEPD